MRGPYYVEVYSGVSWVRLYGSFQTQQEAYPVFDEIRVSGGVARIVTSRGDLVMGGVP